MQSSRCRTTVALLLGVLALVFTWGVVAQQPGGGAPNPFAGLEQGGLLGQGVQADAEMRKLIEGEAAAAREVSSLVKEYGRTDKEEARDKTRTKLAAALAKQFELQQKRRDLELSRLEAKLKKLRGLMKKRDEERKSIIDKRLDQLVREADGLGWTPPPGPASSNFGRFGDMSGFRPQER